MAMKFKTVLKRSQKGSILLQLMFFLFMFQILFTMPPFVPQQVSAEDSWEGATNDSPSTATDLKGIAGRIQSMKNNPSTPLMVNTTSPDFYNFTVEPGFYFQVIVDFDIDIAYDIAFPYNLLSTQSDIDLELYSGNGTLLGESKGAWYEESIGPILTAKTEMFMINVTAVKDPYIGVDYSTLYNMSIIFDDEWEIIKSNDKFQYLDDPTDGFSDDEIVPGFYDNLRFSTDAYTEYRDHDWYVIWLYNNTYVTMTVNSYIDSSQATVNGPNIYIYDENYNGTQPAYHFHPNNDADLTEYVKFSTNYSGWFYIDFANLNGVANFYNLTIDIEDGLEWNQGVNNDRDSANNIPPEDYPGMVTSEGKDDWYRTLEKVKKDERILIEINYFPFIGKLNLSLWYINATSHFIFVESGIPIFQGLRIGPHRAELETFYYIHVSGKNPDPRYYNLSIHIEDRDDRLEDLDEDGIDNDHFLFATLLSSKSHTFKPTQGDPWGGLVSLKGDPDWYAISLQPSDKLTVRIDFNGTLGDLNLILFDGASNILDESKESSSNIEEVYVEIRKADTYLFLVYGEYSSYNGTALDYNMTVILDEFDDFLESNDVSQDAAPIAEGHHADLILRDGDDDWYYVYLAESDLISINLTYIAETDSEGYFNDIDLDLLDENKSFATEDPNAGRTLFNESITLNISSSGKYYIFCKIFGSTNTYNLTLNIIEADDIHEDNDKLEDATRITVTAINETVSVPIDNLRIRVKDDDYFVVDVSAGLAIIVEISFSSSENLELELLSPNGSVLDSSLLQTGNSERVGPLPINSTYTDLYNTTDVYFRVFMNEGLTTTYSINLTVGPEELLITRETVPPFTESTSKPKPPDLLGSLIVLGGGAAVIGGGTALVLYGVNKRTSGGVSRTFGKIRGRFRRGGGGEGG